MRVERLKNRLHVRRATQGLTCGDIDAAVWPRLKEAKAKGEFPNLWVFQVAAKDVQNLGLGGACELCMESLADSMEKEGMNAIDVTVICGCSGELEAGDVRVIAECADEHTMKIRLAMARASQKEIRRGGTAIKVLCSWEVDPVEITHGATIGRDPSCDIVVDAPAVSRRHAQIIARGVDEILYIDRSTNGSSVNGVIVHGACVPIREGSRIGLAPSLYMEVLGNSGNA